MEDNGTAAGKQTPLTRALATIRELRRRLEEREGGGPVAIVGTGLRLPGGIGDLDGYWRMLAEGRDLVRPMPAERREPFAEEWRGLPQRGGFLDGVLDFDAGFFGISPREARHLDPQHRLLLEVAWEALEDAALPADAAAAARTGFYLGIMWQDYRDWLAGEPDAYWTTGNGHNFAAGRIAHALGLTGPTLAVDTACSSSLVAVHLAVQALRRGECEVALAGGANLILSPRSMRLVAETRSLAPDGRCKTFDARANGFTRGEGCGVVVLKRLDRALRDGDRIHAVIRGTALNQDGRAGGFTAPNVLSQVSLIETALAEAGLEPADIGYVETHGTGTSLGDPIEMEALATALGRRNGGRPLAVGALKTNAGHLESAAGVAGLVKAVLSLRERRFPPLVHFRTLNPRIDLSGTGITVPSELTDWDPAAGRHAAVSSFGMSGTNAHIILADPREPGLVEDPPAPEPDGAPAGGFEISARTGAALRALADRYAAALDGLDPADYAAFAHTATFGRTRLDVRARIEAADPGTAARRLRALASGAEPAGVTVVRDVPAGAADDGAGVPTARRVIDLPFYPWQRTRYAPESLGAGRAVQPAAPTAPETALPETALPETHQLVWQPVEPLAGSKGVYWVLAGDDVELVKLLLGAAAQRGAAGTVLGPDALAPAAADAGWEHRPLPAGSDGWSGFWAGHRATESIALLLVPEPEPASSGDDAADTDIEASAKLCADITSAVHGLRAASETGPARAFVTTQGARRIDDQDQVDSLRHGLLHGLAPVMGLEFSTVWGGIVDLPADPEPDDAGALLGFVAGETTRGPGAASEDLAAVRGGRILGARLSTVPEHAPHLPVRDDATYLVTGGLGAVGRELVKDLVRRGARHLLLIGRRPEEALGAEAAGLLAELRGRDVSVAYRGGGCDTPAAMAAACAPLGGMPAVRGVIHAAGSSERAPAEDTGTEEFAAALRNKYAAAWSLHRAAERWPLDFFVLVSSVSAVWGTEGYAAYSAANGGLDALAAHRRSRGLPATSIAYGPWTLDGLGMADEEALERYARVGVGALTAERGCAALADRSPGASGHVVSCPLDLARLDRVMSGLRPRALFGDGTAPDGRDRPATPAAAELAALPERAREPAARARVRRLVAAQLGHDDPQAVDEGTGFFELGLDSIMAADLVAGLAEDFGTDLAAADVFDHPTVAELAAHVLERWSEGPGPRPARARPAAPPRAAHPAAGTGSATEREEGVGEPIAIVGMAGRFPGADSVEALWELLRDGRDGVGPVPPGRWDGLPPGRTGPDGEPLLTTDQGGFLQDVDRFDAAFFGLPAREADALDPQQRLLLESTWHALEDAGIDPRSLRRSRTGVFVGISYSDYARVLARGGLEDVDAYYGTGTALNAAAGRISFTLGLNGPAVAVDTACSSSLVALHLAVRSLRSGESTAALAGGVNLLLDPTSSVAVSRAHMLSPDGRCRTFSADANGFVRAEGCGVVVLKRLADARRDGDRVLAVIRGSAVNQDGASSGLTAPSGRAQEEMLRAALADAGLPGSAVSYLEAHGTGTALGDPIELGAAWRVLGPGRGDGSPLLVGSVKSNVGHCESAAGIVAVIKTVLALRHGLIPPNLHFTEPNPQVAWADMDVRVVADPAPWPAGDGTRVAGVSGFGFTGTNAHVLLADPDDRPAPAPGPAEATGGPARNLLVPLSAPDPGGLARLSAAWRERLAEAAEEELPALAAVAGAGRAHFPYRRTLFGKSRDQLLSALDEPAPADPVSDAPRIAFLFSGQGSQYFGMGRELYETEPVFRDTFDACDEALEKSIGASLTELTLYGEDRDAINETQVTQPALVALELALAALWESWGVVPAAVMGHSVGEIAAAVHAGVMDRPTGLTLIAERARLMQGTERGGMLAIVAPEADAAAWADEHGLDLAAVNGPEAVVLSGPPDAVDGLAAHLKERKVRHRRLSVSHAFHSRLLDPALAELADVLKPLDFHDPEVPIVSNLTGRVAGPGEFDARYWTRHARRPVRFHDGVTALRDLDVDLCLEIGPDRTLINLVRAAGLAPPGGVAGSLRRGGADHDALLAVARTLYSLGQDLRWERIQTAPAGVRPDAPRYPFARTRHWASSPDTAPGQDPGRPVGGPPWGTEVRSPALRGRVFRTERSTAYPPHLTDHRLFGTVSVPGASQLATVLSALGARREPVVLEDLHFPRALVLRDGERYELQVIEAEEDGARAVSVQSLVDPEHGRWLEHLAARVAPPTEAEPPAPPGRAVPDPEEFTASADRHLSGEAFYRHLRGLGYQLGPSFRWIRDAWIRGDEALIRYAEPAVMNEDPADYQIHPGLLDSCLQSSVTFAVGEGEEVREADHLPIPFAAGRVAFPGRPAPGSGLWGHVRAVRDRRPSEGLMQVRTADVHLFDDAGATVLAVDGFRFRPAPRPLLESSLRGDAWHAYELRWDEWEPRLPEAGRLEIGVLGGDGAAPAVEAELEQRGHRVVPLDPEDMSGAESDLIVDARLTAPAASGAPADAFRRLAALADSLRAAPRHIPYAVLCTGDGEDGADAAPVREAAWGLLAALEAEEHDRRLLRFTLTPGWEPAALCSLLAGASAEEFAETRVNLGASGARVARLAPVSRWSVPEGAEHRHEGRAALITGGLGALGLSVAAMLAARGASDITLMSRSEPGEAARALLDELADGGTRVTVVSGDVTDPADCARAVAAAGERAPLTTVMHLAGVTDDRPFEELTAESFAKVFAAKAHGAENLAEALRGDPPEAFVLFSSASAVLGTAGQTAYAAANGYLGGLARRLRAAGLPAVAIDWGPWVPAAGGGLAGSAAAARAAESAGLRPLGDDEAAELLDLALARRRSRLIAMAVDAERATRPPHGRARAALFGAAASTGRAGGAGSGRSGRARGWLRAELDALDPDARGDRLRAAVRELVGEALGDPTAVQDETGFTDLGLDSIMVIDLRSRLALAAGAELPATVALDHPTIARLAGHVLGLLYPEPEPVPEPEPEPVRAGEPPVEESFEELTFEDLVRAVEADLEAGAEGGHHGGR
ncbi:Acyl transferase domain-containing protein [Actinomadura meyerae]|uniref:Acyl transferase domain-containing protein n=1 Tax=Actinomadura meyerae TaxID=240840 RepID=A0A239GKM6_9ACTN|nr:type I polyketide synthase [Actinomadura meyerae]SNS68614.1 Acyl transferase domain-containing protein [Actinomadura meyerae]